MLANLAIVILAVTAGTFAFTCPEDDHSFYHADVSSGCTVYHLCENGQLQTLNCPANQAFNHETTQCEDASTVSCVETMDHHMHHHHSTRAKRNASSQKHLIPPVLQGFVEPVITSLIFPVQEAPVSSKFILPIVYEMMADPQTKFDLLNCWFSVKNIFSPLVWEMIYRQTFNTTQGTVFRFPRESFDRTKQYFKAEIKPTLLKIFNKHEERILWHVIENMELIPKSRVKTEGFKISRRLRHFELLEDLIVKFVNKHRSMALSTDTKYMKSFIVSEIEKDLKPIYITVLQIFMEYTDKDESSWLQLWLNS